MHNSRKKIKRSSIAMSESLKTRPTRLAALISPILIRHLAMTNRLMVGGTARVSGLTGCDDTSASFAWSHCHNVGGSGVVPGVSVFLRMTQMLTERLTTLVQNLTYSGRHRVITSFIKSVSWTGCEWGCSAQCAGRSCQVYSLTQRTRMIWCEEKIDKIWIRTAQKLRKLIQNRNPKFKQW